MVKDVMGRSRWVIVWAETNRVGKRPNFGAGQIRPTQILPDFQIRVGTTRGRKRVQLRQTLFPLHL